MPRRTLALLVAHVAALRAATGAAPQRPAAGRLATASTHAKAAWLARATLPGNGTQASPADSATNLAAGVGQESANRGVGEPTAISPKTRRALKALEDEKKQRKEQEEQQKADVEQVSSALPGYTVCTCNCELRRDGKEGAELGLPPIWNERVFPGDVVAEMERRCIQEECPKAKLKCREDACKNKLKCHKLAADDECGTTEPIAKCAFHEPAKSGAETRPLAFAPGPLLLLLPFVRLGA